jgi:hypothetical protein
MKKKYGTYYDSSSADTAEFGKEYFGLSVRVIYDSTVVDIIKEFYGILPGEMSLKALSLDRTGALVIEGLAQTGSEVNKLQNGLVNSPLFKEVNLQYATKRRRFNEEYTDFKIICRLANRSQVAK